ncbi:hypothetical protein WSS_A34292 [Rhodococcus opacus M213]|uniref:Lipoprotein n=1 Tax=Rhodococcus opacus M213 TaxID=1129896 RepID=K8X9C0_RHOOP|nr:hypothetical protein [Rhodococcus opacus]EKT78088.1 hypothetical protein WSS_A34292 [Rhodococcus opacus M213]
MIPTSLRRQLLVAAATAAALTVSACGHTGSDDTTGTAPPAALASAVPGARSVPVPTSPPVTPPSELPAAYRDVDRSSPDAVAAAVTELWYGWDTTRDSGPYDAKLRALPLLDPATVTDLVTHPPISGPGADWLALAAAGAIAHVSSAPAHEAGAPADTDLRAYRLREVIQEFTGNPPPPRTQRIVSVVLRRTFDGWRAESVVAR